MSAPRDHHHGHHGHDDGHDHHHGDSHDHHHGGDSGLSFEQKLIRRIEHSIAHNEEHARAYRDWAQRATDGGIPETAEELEAAAQATLQVSRRLEEALRSISRK